MVSGDDLRDAESALQPLKQSIWAVNFGGGSYGNGLRPARHSVIDSEQVGDTLWCWKGAY